MPGVTPRGFGFSLDASLPPGSPSCPLDGFTSPTASPLRSSRRPLGQESPPALHRLRPAVLGLGPASPWVDQRCPGTLRLSVGWILTTRDSTHSGIRTSARSTSPSGPASPLAERSPTSLSSLLDPRGSTASVGCFSLLVLSAPARSTSELLRTLSMMAASKPTSWLSGPADLLSHSAAPWRP